MRTTLRVALAAAMACAATLGLTLAHADSGAQFSTPNNAIVVAVPADLSETGIATALTGTAEDDTGITGVKVTITDLAGNSTVIDAAVAEDGSWSAPLGLQLPGQYTAAAAARTGGGDTLNAAPITINVI